MYGVRRRVSIIAAATLASAAITAGAFATPASDDEPLTQLSTQTVRGERALDTYAGRVDNLARRNGLETDQLRQILADDSTSRIDSDARLFYVEPTAPRRARTTKAESGVARADVPEDVFALHSRPDSHRVIYLDFNGHTITGTAWNESKGTDPVEVTPYDTDGDPATFGNDEQAVVYEVWQRIAEDYSTLDVDVTTEDPGDAAINRTDQNDLDYGTRLLVDPTDWYQSECGCGGVAYVGVFDNADEGKYQPALVFTDGVGTGAKNIAEAASHEVGHNLGLSHDSTSAEGYYSGHGPWAPIMGVGYNKAITQWSKGEYADANEQQDDYAVMGENGTALLDDDHGDSEDAATTLEPGTPVAGVSAAEGDADYFEFTATAGEHTISASPAAVGANLDIKLTLLDAAGEVIGTYDPAAEQVDDATAKGLDATATETLEDGTYYLRVEGTGFANPLDTGYSTYGSRGAYTVKVS